MTRMGLGGFVGLFVNMAIESANANVVFLSESFPGTLLREEDLPPLLHAESRLSIMLSALPRKWLTLREEVLYLLHAVGL